MSLIFGNIFSKYCWLNARVHHIHYWYTRNTAILPSIYYFCLQDHILFPELRHISRSSLRGVYSRSTQELSACFRLHTTRGRISRDGKDLLTWCIVCTNQFLTLYHAKFFRGNQNIYLHFMSFLHIDITQAVEIIPQVRQELAYSTPSISWVLMSWRKEPGH